MLKNVAKKQNGITIIALIVTIIVLLIIAGIALNGILGPNGIQNKANSAKNQTEFVSACEEIKLKIAEINSETLTTKR